MNLISCGSCGVVLDTNRIIKEDIHDHGTFEVLLSQAAWDGEAYKATMYCPSCNDRIFYDNGDTV